MAVVRHQAKLEANRRNVTGKAKEPVAGTSRGTTEMIEKKKATDVKSKKGLNQDEEPKAMSKSTGTSKQGSTGLSQAKINVMKTMIYIVICFAICWMPRASYSLYKKLTVTKIKSLLDIILSYL